MKTLNKTLLVLFSLTLFFVNPSFAENTVQPSNVKAKLLFVLVSKQGEITQNSKNHYLLKLKGVNPKVISFTDRPMRVTSKLNIKEFVNKWTNGSFKTNPPNAVMQAVLLHDGFKKGDAKSISYAIELQNPNYQAHKNTLTFEITALKGDKTQLPKLLKSDYVTLFIDAYGCSGSSCW